MLSMPQFLKSDILQHTNKNMPFHPQKHPVHRHFWYIPGVVLREVQQPLSSALHAKDECTHIGIGDNC